MTDAELVIAMSDRPLCIRCLSVLSAPLSPSALMALFEGGSEVRVDTCVGCRSETRMTYRLNRARRLAA